MISRTPPIIKLSILAVVICLGLCGDLRGQGHEQRLAKIDVQHYRFAIELTDDSNSIEGLARIKIKFRQNADRFRLDFVAASRAGQGMRIKELREGDTEVQYVHRGDRLTIVCGTSGKVGQTRIYTIRYQGVASDGLVISKNRHGSRTFFGDNWPNRARHWLPTVDHPSDKATVEFLVTAPTRYQVVSNGIQVEESNLDKNRRLTHWKSDVPLPTKVMVIGAAEFAVQASGRVNETAVSSWVFRQQRQAGFHDFALAVPILKYYVELIGPYPYAKLANVQSKTRWGGMENAGCIFYSEKSVTGNRASEGLIAHEIVHQWFGNSASEANWHHVWLSEGFATYLTHMYFEDSAGQRVFLGRLQRDRKLVTNYAKAFSSPIVDITIEDFDQVLNANSYQKAGWVLHMLRKQLGDEKFQQGLREYYRQFRLSNALTSDFRHVMERVSGQNLKHFFKQWVFTAGHPELKTDWSYDKQTEQVALTVQQQQTGPAFRFPLEIKFSGAGDQHAVRTFQINAKETHMQLDLDFTPTKIQLDPNCAVV